MLLTAKLVIFLCPVISQGKVVALDRWGGKWNHLSMTHRLTTNCAKNYCNGTLIVKVIVENVVTCFLGTRCICQTLDVDLSQCWGQGLFFETGFVRKPHETLCTVYLPVDESFIKTKERLSRKLKCKIIVGGHLCDPIKFVKLGSHPLNAIQARSHEARWVYGAVLSLYKQNLVVQLHHETELKLLCEMVFAVDMDIYWKFGMQPSVVKVK